MANSGCVNITREGNAKSRKGDYDGAIIAYSKAIGSNTNSVILYYDRGLAAGESPQKCENGGDNNGVVYGSDEYIHREIIGGCIGLVLGVPMAWFFARWLNKRF